MIKFFCDKCGEETKISEESKAVQGSMGTPSEFSSRASDEIGDKNIIVYFVLRRVGITLQPRVDYCYPCAMKTIGQAVKTFMKGE